MDHRPVVYHRATQFRCRYRRHRSHLAGGRLRSHHADGFDGDLWRRLRDANSYAHSYGDRDSDINTNGYADCFAVIDAYTDSNTFGYAYSDSRLAHRVRHRRARPATSTR